MLILLKSSLYVTPPSEKVLSITLAAFLLNVIFLPTNEAGLVPTAVVYVRVILFSGVVTEPIVLRLP